jgi:putative phosphoribosyl transferase
MRRARMFQNRHDAATQLAGHLLRYRGEAGIVLAIPRGGVPIGAVVAHALGFPLEVLLAKKIGHPTNREYAIGVVTLAGATVNEQVHDVSQEYLDAETTRLKTQLRESLALYMAGRPLTPLAGKTVVVVDDGIATGQTMVGTVRAIRASQPSQLVVAVPVASPPAAQLLRPLVDELVCLLLPPDFRAVGRYYHDFEQVSDYEVVRLLRETAGAV